MKAFDLEVAKTKGASGFASTRNASTVKAEATSGEATYDASTA